MTKELFFDKWGPSDSKDWQAFREDLEKVAVPTEYLLTGWMTDSGSAMLDISKHNGNEWVFVRAQDLMPSKEWAEDWARKAYPGCQVHWLDDRGGMKSQ